MCGHIVNAAKLQHLQKLRAVTRYMRELDGSISAYQLEAFLIVAGAGPEGMSMRDIEARMQIGNATLSRVMSNWSKWKKPDVPGMDMIEINIDPRDRRFRIATLTPKGVAVAEKIATMME